MSDETLSRENAPISANILASAAVTSNLPVLDWIVQHAEQSPAILADLEQIVAGATVADKWTAFKSLGDLVVADIASFPLECGAAPERAALVAFASHPVVRANGAIINLVLQNLPQIVVAIQSIIALFNKPSA